MVARTLSAARAGFTLVELLVVVAILGLVALGLPGLFGAGQGAALDAAASEIVGGMIAARREARLGSLSTALTFDPARARWRDAQGRPRALAEGIALSVFAPASARHDDGTVQLRFTPDGGAEGGRITLARGRSTAVVELDWMTGHAQLVR